MYVKFGEDLSSSFWDTANKLFCDGQTDRRTTDATLDLLREGSLFINGGVRAEGGGGEKKRDAFRGGAKKFSTSFRGGRKKIIFFIFQLEANKLFVLW